MVHAAGKCVVHVAGKQEVPVAGKRGVRVAGKRGVCVAGKRDAHVFMFIIKDVTMDRGIIIMHSDTH